MTSLNKAIKTVEAVKDKAYKVLGIDSEGTFWKVKALDGKGVKDEILVNKDSSKILNVKKND